MSLSDQSVGTIRQWMIGNGILLGCYLGFFHLSLIVAFPGSLVVGILFAATTSILCLRYRRLFLNRYEGLFYQVIPLDILLESLIPYHSGYSFYVCALAFWLVFVSYRLAICRFSTAKLRTFTSSPRGRAGGG